MQRALELAVKGLGSVAPNPMVGCVIVHKGKIIAEGWHRKFGEAHAEVNAINAVLDKSLLRESTLYVTLEPCSHFGKTPPCANRIVQEGIPKVVIASVDPNPLVSGKGISILKEAGIEVTSGILESEARFLNRRFFTAQTQKRPYVICKWAESADGFIDPVRMEEQKGSIAISGPESQLCNHMWRTQEQAILVGKRTAIIDNPSLTARLWPGQNPLRVVIDPSLEISRKAALYDNSVRTIIFNRLETRNIFNTQLIQLDFSVEIIPAILQYLHYEGIHSIIIEGGTETIQRFMQAGMVDEIRRIVAENVWLETGLKAPEFNGDIHETNYAGNDRIELSYLF
ncbi:MAG: bifunctional diaminohydroxyphosphoribosylaminopyrimidine deaminase/5-amino-6-(5-phosphoribosylamino)uracil reductase RibD [Bacteroidia bacterium]